MTQRPSVGAVGRTISVLTPEGEAEFHGTAFPVRAHGGGIDSGRFVLVTGFDPWALTVREATPEEVATQPPASRHDEAGSRSKAVLWVLGALVFGTLLFVGSSWSFRVSGLAGCGYLLAMVGYWWLLVLLIRECQPDAIGLALVIPFFLWYFACQRWDVAKWPCLINILGLVLNVVGIAGVG